MTCLCGICALRNGKESCNFERSVAAVMEPASRTERWSVSEIRVSFSDSEQLLALVSFVWHFVKTELLT